MKDEEIIKEIQMGDYTNYVELEKRYEKAIFSLIYKYRLQKDFEDYFQIGRMRFLECCKSFDFKRNAKLISYMMSSISKEFLRIRQDGLFDDSMSSIEGQPDIAAEEESKEKFMYMISNLSEEDRLIIIDYFWYGLTQKEIGEKIGYSREFVRDLIPKILKKLEKDVLL